MFFLFCFFFSVFLPHCISQDPGKKQMAHSKVLTEESLIKGLYTEVQMRLRDPQGMVRHQGLAVAGSC